MLYSVLKCLHFDDSSFSSCSHEYWYCSLIFNGIKFILPLVCIRWQQITQSCLTSLKFIFPPLLHIASPSHVLQWVWEIDVKIHADTLYIPCQKVHNLTWLCVAKVTSLVRDVEWIAWGSDHVAFSGAVDCPREASGRSFCDCIGGHGGCVHLVSVEAGWNTVICQQFQPIIISLCKPLFVLGAESHGPWSQDSTSSLESS